MPQNVETGSWMLAFVVLAGLAAMIVVVALAARRNRGTTSRERAERVGLRGAEGLKRAQERHEEHG